MVTYSIPGLSWIASKTAGTTPGGHYRDASGREWLIKVYRDQDRAYNDVLAMELYQLAGASVPHMRIMEADGRDVLASRWIDEPLSPITPETVPLVWTDFAADAWLANWDVVVHPGNTQIGNRTGTAWRIDLGGALMYRALGAWKGPRFGPRVTEWDSLRSSRYPASHRVFSEMTADVLRESAARVLSVTDEQIEEAVYGSYLRDDETREELAETLMQRREDIARRI